MDYKELSLDELRELNNQLGEQIKNLRNERIEIKHIIDLRLAEETIKAKVENMSEAEKEIMHQYINVSAADSLGVGKNG